jgi:CheY-like chemotaxis protein
MVAKRMGSAVCHVLIIEDEALIALNLQMVLEENGATSFDFAETEDEAVAAAAAHRPDFILSDVRLKRGTGPGAVTTIRRLMGALPVIFVTASPELCIPGQPPGVVLAKPLHEPTIARVFREMSAAA